MLNLRSIDLNLLTVFDMLVKEKNLSRAADRLGMSQPAVSQALARLRATLDDDLFIRTHEGMLPTPKAREIAGDIADALQLIRESISTTRHFDPQVSRRVFNVDFGPLGELVLLPKLVEIIAPADGRVVIRSLSAPDESRLHQLTVRTLDYCVDYQPPRDPKFNCRKVVEDSYVIIARKRHPRLRDTLTPADFLREQHILLSLDDKRRERVNRFIAEQVGERDVLAETRHYPLIPRLVLQSDALAIVPESIVETSPLKSRLQVFPTPFDARRLELFLIWHKALDRDPGHQWLLEELSTQPQIRT